MVEKPQSNSNMITLFDSPGPISLSRNFINFKLKATKPNGQPYGDQVASVRITIGRKLNTGEKISIDFQDENGTELNVEFLAVANPILNTHLPDSSSNLSISDYLKEIESIIKVEPYIASNLIVAGFGIDLGNISSRTINIYYQSYFPGQVISIEDNAFSANTVQTLAIASTLPDFHKVKFQVMVQNGNAGSFSRVVETESKINNEGLVNFDIKDILHAHLQYQVGDSLPPYGNNTPLLADNTRQYFVRYCESWEGVDQPWKFSQIKKVLYGGESVERHKICNFFDNLSETNSLLTWYPDRKTVGVDSPEYLPWINYTSDSKEVYIRVFLFSQNLPGAEFSKEAFNGDNLITVDPYRTILIPVGFNQLELGLTASTVLKYNVQIFDADTDQPVSQVRTYNVDHLQYPDERHVMYLNGFHVPCTLRLKGKQEKATTVERQKSTRILNPDFKITDGERFQYDQSFEQDLIYRSGYLSKNEVEALHELIIYNKVFELFSDGYRRIDITDKKYQITKSLQFLHTLTFKARNSINWRSYSNYLIPCDSAELCGPENWQTADGRCWKTSDGLNWELV